MKNKKWLTYTLGILLTLIILAVVGGAGYRIGMMQSTSFARPMDRMGTLPFAHRFDGNQQHPGVGGFQGMQGNPLNRGFDHRGFERHGWGMSFLSSIFWLIRLAVLGLLIWIVFKLVQKSGWRLTRVSASPAPPPSGNETPNVEVEKNKDSE